MKADATGDPEVTTRIAQYEMAFRMQASVPELTDLSKEPQARSISTARMRGSPARSPPIACSRAAWPSVAFVSSSSYHRDWDHHGDLPKALPARCKDTDQASAALLTDLNSAVCWMTRW